MKGIYVLIIDVAEDIDVNVGALGKTALAKGLYAYVGSAQTNLDKRIKRHFKNEKQKFWHIDYLLDHDTAKIIQVLYREANKTEECKTAKTIGEKGKPILHFGSSDCECKSHLYQIENHVFLQQTMQHFPT